VELNIISKKERKKKKAVVSLSKFWNMLIVFFDIQRIVLAGWVPSSLTVNQHNYIEVLTK